MKRLWVRLSAVAAVVATLGGGGYYFFSSGTAASEAPASVVAENDNPTKPEKEVIPVPDVGGQPAPRFDAAQAALTDQAGYQPGPTEPAQATWRDEPSQPIIRQVSSQENESGYGGGSNFDTGAPPPADPTNAMVAGAAAAGAAIASAGAAYDSAGAAYNPAGAYDGAETTPSYAPAGYGAAGNPAPVATADGGYGTYGNDASGHDSPANGPSGYAADAPAAPPAAPPRDVSEGVAAPTFANGDSIAASSPAATGYGEAQGDLSTQPGVGSSSTPQFDSSRAPQDGSPTPQFDTTQAPLAEVREPAATAAYTPPPTTPPPTTPPATYGQAQALAATGAALVAATPGARTLDGRQTPSISVEKLAPAEIQVGKPAAFKTLVRNTGQVTAKNVTVTDRLPQGTQLIDVTPQPNQSPDGSMVWQFDSLEPNEEVVISMEVMPQVEGEIGNQALVTFQAQASVRTICTKPQLLVEHSTDPKVLVGEDVIFSITISNPGSGDATGIILEEDVPPGLSHVAGEELEYEIGTLRPGDSKRLELVLKASEAGITNNKLRVRGDANLLAEHTTQLEVISPKLQVGTIGPQRRYLDRKVKYQVVFSNTGTAIAKNVELATYLPKGLKFVSTSGKGQYDERGHAVYWGLDQLAPGQEGTVELIAIPIAVGEQKLRTEGTADLGLSHKHEHTTVVDAITALVFTVSDTQDPIEVGSETTYEIFIANNGSKTGTNVQVAAILPTELTPLSGEGTSRVTVQGQQVIMEPLDKMGPGDEATYKIKVKGRLAGDHVIDVRLVCDELPTPVTKQEITKVYSDGF